MSSDEDLPSGIAVPAKKRRVQRACDMCRVKKRSSLSLPSVHTKIPLRTGNSSGDGLRMSEKKCTNCIENGLACTFAGALAKRRSYIDALEARLELTESLLRKGCLNLYEEYLNPTPGSSQSQWSGESPVLQHQSELVTTASGHSGPGVLLAALNIRSMNTLAPAPHGDDLAHLALLDDLESLSISQAQNRFQGKSSSAILVKAAVQLREGYEEKDMPWSSRRMHYWTYSPVKHRVPHTGPFVFPDPDLLLILVDLYFIHKNLYFPLLHRPSFERSIADGLHTRDTAFGAVVLLVCAIASRFCHDERVCKEGEEPLRRGWEFFDQLEMKLDHLFETPSVFHLQYYCLATSFLEYSFPVACWTLIGIGIRLAQDVGAHRQREGPPTVESELWKRGFWVLVSYDRQVSMVLGRSCATQYEDIDADLPIECDDEYWENEDPKKAFVQPPGKPCLTTFFNCYLRLNNILAFGLKMLYSLNKTKRLLAYRDQAWEEHIVAEMDSALNGWIDSIPAHLRWDPNRRDDAFFDQSALLHCSYYQVQMTIHRPFIPTIREGEPTSLPSLAICTNAARSCSHVADISRLRKNGVPVPVLISSVFTSGVILLLNVWSGKRTGLPPHMNSAIAEVHKCMATMRVCEKMWQTAGLYYDLLYELATIGQVPLPKDATPAPTPAATRAQPPGHKRGREEDDDASQSQYPHAPAPPVAHPPYANVLLPTSAPPAAAAAAAVNTSQTAHAQQQQQFNSLSLPTYTSDLGKLPVFHQRTPPPLASTSTWYPTQSPAPLGRPDFVVGQHLGAAQPDTLGDASIFSDPFFTPDSSGYGSGGGGTNSFGFGAGARAGADGAGTGMSSDVMAMWANAPTSFEVDDWGVYLSVMSELNQGLDAPAPQM
ncbi:Zn(2)-C6 fungal-type domain-containing protein [Mycena venus]|uniref:Zn(2)-C6 fungal-type domain-containing protein n=1 Tax=Mycena venus TaxID=2733690 RepID=A0A8H6XT01_9AGAR|nr:Zn(2)-C6 fungal-type domain-containing protein [Mycena venus]